MVRVSSVRTLVGFSLTVFVIALRMVGVATFSLGVLFGFQFAE